MRKLALSWVLLLAAPANAQTTYTPSFNAPYRAFTRHEFGGTVSFPQNYDYALAGQYRFGYDNMDLGLRGGVAKASGGASVALVGFEARARALSHTQDFPLDGALVVGVGGRFVSGTSIGVLTAGFSVGRRVDPKDSP